MATIRYRLRTPTSYGLIVGLMVGLCGFALYALHRAGGFASGGRAAVVVAITAGVPVIALAATAAYRAWPGGHVTFTDDAVVVRRGRRPGRFAHADGVQVTAQQIDVQLTAALIPVATLDRGQLVTIGCGSRRVKFSTLLVAPDDRAALLADLGRAARGEPPVGRTPPPPPPPRTAHDALLDDELDRAD
ncbi:MAG: hypothetical protein IPL61_38175 [Myxococcales bacterium]|nr:hypothetical protein [Myxococcales bacterium]